MGKRASDGATLKRPAAYVSSNNGPLLSEAAVEALEATRNINDFRKRARELGFCTAHRNSDGVRCNRTRADILEDCRRRLCRRDINHFRECARVLGVATQHRNAAGQLVNRRKADMLEDCLRQLKVQRHGAIRTRAVERGVKRYKPRVSTRRIPWRKNDKSMQVPEKGSLPALFAKQRGVAP